MRNNYKKFIPHRPNWAISWPKIISAVWALLIVIWIGWALFRRDPNMLSMNLTTPKTTPTNFAWPQSGEAAIGLVRGDAIGCKTRGASVSRPTASVAKVITALVVLEKYPLKNGDSGPVITMKPADVDLYNQIVAGGGSNLPVVVGEKLTEKQLLQAMMIVSSDNSSDSLATWAFGGLAHYKVAATKWLHNHHLNKTRLGTDASGLDPGTTSTANDLCHLMGWALQNPILTDIMSTRSIDNFPLGHNTGTINNTNRSLGRAGIFAGKTGSLGSGFYNLVTAAHVNIDGRTTTVISTVMGQDNFVTLFDMTANLIQSTGDNIVTRDIRPGQIIGYATNRAGTRVALTVKTTLLVASWRDQKINLQANFFANKGAIMKNSIVGFLSDPTSGFSAPIVVKNTLAAPSFLWRLTHP